MILGSDSVSSVSNLIEGFEIFCRDASINKDKEQLIKIFNQVLTEQNIGVMLDLLETASNLLVGNFAAIRKPITSHAVMSTFVQGMEVIQILRMKSKEFATQETKRNLSMIEPILLPIISERCLLSEVAMYM